MGPPSAGAALASLIACSSSVRRVHLDDVGAEAAGVRGEVDGQPLPLEPAGLLVAEPVVRAEPLRSEGLRERADGVEPVVLHEDDDHLDPLLHGGDELGRHHQVAAVADHGEDVPALVGEADADRGGDLVAHAGVPVLDVVGLAVAHPPQLVQVARHGAGGAEHDVARVGELVDRSQHLALRQQALGQGVGHLGRRVVGRLDLGVPLGPQRGLPLAVSGCHGIPLQCRGERGEGLAGVGHDREPGVLARIEPRDVDVHEPDTLVLEGGTRRGREVAPPGAHADDEVCLSGERVGGSGPGGADGAHLLRVAVRERALARLALTDRYAGLLTERAQRLLRAGVVHAAPDHDQWPLRGPDEGGGVGDVDLLGQRPGDAPDPLREQLDRPVEGLGLDVLGQGDGGRPGLDRVGEHPHGPEQGRRQLLRAAHPVEEA